MRRLTSHYLLTPKTLIPNGIVTVDDDGIIASIDASDSVDSMENVEHYSGIIIPGMVNAHTHLELSYLRGRIPEGCGFAGFARAMREVRNTVSVEDMISAARFHDRKMWTAGVSSVGDISNTALTFDLKNSSEIHYRTFLEVYGFGKDHDGTIRSFADNTSDPDYGITPHSTYSLDHEGFHKALTSTPDRPLSIHFMESREELELFGGKGKMYEWYLECGIDTGFTARFNSPCQRILEISPDRNVLLVHNTFIDEQTIEKLSTHFADNLTFVLCPNSNIYLTGQLPPVNILRKHGVRIAVGTDSLASNKELDLIEELKIFDGIPLLEMLCWVTVNGRTALGEDPAEIAIGQKANLVLLSGVDMKKMELTKDSRTRRLI